jgi:hypothetical protein
MTRPAERRHRKINLPTPRAQPAGSSSRRLDRVRHPRPRRQRHRRISLAPPIDRHRVKTVGGGCCQGAASHAVDAIESFNLRGNTTPRRSIRHLDPDRRWDSTRLEQRQHLIVIRKEITHTRQTLGLTDDVDGHHPREGGDARRGCLERGVGRFRREEGDEAPIATRLRHFVGFRVQARRGRTVIGASPGRQPERRDHGRRAQTKSPSKFASHHGAMIA